MGVLTQRLVGSEVVSGEFAASCCLRGERLIPRSEMVGGLVSSRASCGGQCREASPTDAAERDPCRGSMGHCD